MKIKSIILCLLATTIISGCKKEETKPEINYTNFKILSVKVTAMPFLDPADNTSWDPLDGPDVFFNMETSGNAIVFDGSSSRINNIAPSNLPLTWNFVSAHNITNINVTQYVTLYDYDSVDPNDPIGYVGFTMSDHKSNYSKTITKSNMGITVTITGEWY